MPKAAKQPSFTTYAERRLQLALNHEFHDQESLESLIMLLISETETFNPVDFGFLYPMIEVSPNLNRRVKIALYRRFQALDIPVRDEYESKMSREASSRIFGGLFMPLDMPLLDVLLSANWVPEVGDVINVAGASELRWVVERLQKGIGKKWKARLVREIIAETADPRRGELLSYLFEIEGWNFSSHFDKGLQDALMSHPDIYRKYNDCLRLFDNGDTAITYLNSCSRTGTSVTEVMVDALEIATPELKRRMSDNRARRRLDDPWEGCLSNLAALAIRANAMGFLERILTIGQQLLREWEDNIRISGFVENITRSAGRAMKLEPWKLLFRYIPVAKARAQFAKIPPASKFNKFAEEVRAVFRSQYGEEAPVRAAQRRGGRRARVVAEDNAEEVEEAEEVPEDEPDE